MAHHWPRRLLRVVLLVTPALLLSAPTARLAQAATPLLQISADPFTNTTSQHKTQVEPDSFAYGSTIVAAVQTGRFTDGGSSDIGWATSKDGGTTWTHGFLPNTTIYVGGTLGRLSDPSVAYDAAHNTWLIASLPIGVGAGVPTVGAISNRSTDGGLTWSNPVFISTQNGTDKTWIACDNTATSPFYGHCYAEWDNNSNGNLIQMSTSSDGGQTWGPARSTANSATGIGGQPVVQPSGTVVVPIANANETAILSFVSQNGGATWGSTVTVATVANHGEAGQLRSGPLPSAEIDAAGDVFVAWSDCRFETGCAANDIVFKASRDGLAWSRAVRVPIAAVGSGADYFLPGLAVDRATSGSSLHLGLTYYYYPTSACTLTTCRLDVGFISSQDGGRTWSAPTQIGGPMLVSWLANTTQGYMVGDYMSTSFSGGKAFPAFVLAGPRSGSQLNEALFTVANGLSLASDVAPASDTAGEPASAPDTGAPRVPLTLH